MLHCRVKAAGSSSSSSSSSWQWQAHVACRHILLAVECQQHKGHADAHSATALVRGEGRKRFAFGQRQLWQSGPSTEVEAVGFCWLCSLAEADSHVHHDHAPGEQPGLAFCRHLHTQHYRRPRSWRQRRQWRRRVATSSISCRGGVCCGDMRLGRHHDGQRAFRRPRDTWTTELLAVCSSGGAPETCLRYTALSGFCSEILRINPDLGEIDGP